MSMPVDILNSEYVGIRELRENMSKILHKNKPVIVTERGVPSKVLLPYADMVELLEIMDELFDREVMKTVGKARKAIKSGKPGIPVAGLFKKIRNKKQ